MCVNDKVALPRIIKDSSLFMSCGCYLHGHCVPLILEVLPIHSAFASKHTPTCAPGGCNMHDAASCMFQPVCWSIRLQMWKQLRWQSCESVKSMVAVWRSCFCILSQKTVSAKHSVWLLKCSDFSKRACMRLVGQMDYTYFCDRAGAFPPVPFTLSIIYYFINFWGVFFNTL